MHVEGRLVIERAVSDGRGRASVRVEDVGRADASAVVAVERDLGTYELVSGRGLEIAFELDVSDDLRVDHHVVAAHVDTTGSGDVSEGDYITMQAIPLAASSSGPVIVPLRHVG